MPHEFTSKDVGQKWLTRDGQIVLVAAVFRELHGVQVTHSPHFDQTSVSYRNLSGQALNGYPKDDLVRPLDANNQ